MEPAREVEAGLVSENETVEVPMDATPEKRAGLFCNAAGVHADSDSVTIDFASVDPGGAPHSAVLQARIRLSHRMAVRLLETLNENVKSWLPQELDAREQEAEALRGILAQLGKSGVEDE